MSGINLGKVAVGALVAAVVFFVIDAASYGLLLREANEANMARLGLEVPAFNAVAIAMWALVEYVFALLAVFTYAAVRPRFGAGPKTAVIVALIFFLTVALMMFGQAQSGFMTMSLYVQGGAAALVSIVAGTVAGAAVYKEA